MWFLPFLTARLALLALDLAFCTAPLLALGGALAAAAALGATTSASERREKIHVRNNETPNTSKGKLGMLK